MMKMLLFLQSAQDLEHQRDMNRTMHELGSRLWSFWITRGHVWWVVAAVVLVFGWAMIQGLLERRRDKKNYKRDHPYNQP